MVMVEATVQDAAIFGSVPALSSTVSVAVGVPCPSSPSALRLLRGCVREQDLDWDAACGEAAAGGPSLATVYDLSFELDTKTNNSSTTVLRSIFLFFIVYFYF